MSNWIKVLNTLPRSRAVFSLMRGMRCKRHAAIGLAVDWFCWLDENSTGGETGMTDEEIDEVLGAKGAAKSLAEIGWIEHDEAGFVVAVDFCKHNGISAKRRAETARRVTKCKAKGNAKSVTKVASGALPDKRRIYNKENGSTDVEPKERRGARPSGAAEVDSYLSTLPVLKLTPEQRQRAAAAYFDEMESVGWVDKQGRNVWDWRAAARRWAASWANNEHTPFRGGQRQQGLSRNNMTSNGNGVNNYDIR